jgi:uncharacterized Zn finger protein
VRVQVECPCCGAKRKITVKGVEFSDWLDSREEPVRCTTCGEQEKLSLTVEADAR